MAEQWENRYASSSRVWSGRPNLTLTQIAPTLPVGRSLDLGCGEGADAIWLASRGWDATGIDLSPPPSGCPRGAVGRAHEHPLRAADLATWNGQRFDLVTAFSSTPAATPSASILRRSAGLVGSRQPHADRLPRTAVFGI